MQLNSKVLGVLVVIGIVLFVGWFILIPLEVLPTIYLYKTLYFGNWVEYKDQRLGLSYKYPASGLFYGGSGFKVTAKGWSGIYNCAPSHLSIIGDTNQIYALSLCDKLTSGQIKGLPTTNLTLKKVKIGGSEFSSAASPGEIQDGLIGRYLEPSDESYMIGVIRPPLSDNMLWFDQVMDKIYIKIISSIKKT